MGTEQQGSSGFANLLRDLRMTLGEVFTGGKMEPAQELFTEVLFGLQGMLARADGIVTSHEAEFVNALMDDLELSLRGREVAMGAFDRGRQRKIDLRAEVVRFMQQFPKGSTQIDKLYDALLRMAAADGRVRPREHEFLTEVTRLLGLSVEALDSRLERFANV